MENYNKFKNTFQLFSFSAFQLQKGQVLFEILLAVGVIVSVVAISVQLTQTSLQSADTAGDRTVMINLARESFESVRAISTEKWQNLHNVTKGNQYHLEVQGGKWVLIAGSENVILGGETYVRYLVVDNVSRDPSSGDIEGVYHASNDDPSTQKVTVTVQKTGLPDFSYYEYVSRWKNASPVQTNWQSGSGQGTNPTSGDSTNFNNQYSSDDNNVDFTSMSGSLKIKTQ
mgnify:CR=1 FL=1